MKNVIVGTLNNKSNLKLINFKKGYVLRRKKKTKVCRRNRISCKHTNPFYHISHLLVGFIFEFVEQLKSLENSLELLTKPITRYLSGG